MIDNLVTQSLYSRPMDLRPKMMFGMVTIVEPDPVIELVITAYPPGNRVVGICAVMAVVTVQLRETVPKIIKGKKETNVMPVQDSEKDERADERR